MYGTVARMRLKPGMEAKLKEDMAQYERIKIPGFVSTMVYRMEKDPNESYMAVAFKDKESRWRERARSRRRHRCRRDRAAPLSVLRRGLERKPLTLEGQRREIDDSLRELPRRVVGWRPTTFPQL